MTLDDLVTLRKSWDFTQTDMADQLGMTLRAYQDIENGRSALRRIHVLAIERIGLAYASAASDPMLAPANVRKDALELARMITG